MAACYSSCSTCSWAAIPRPRRSAAPGRGSAQQQGRVSPETWTHGSAEQRMKWFTQGFKHGWMQACDTWSVQQP
ncbi:neutral zinc metallopeptidase [Bowdeniella nasicola]|uniref:neutral zinc metallopeptidase n=1 Tax=Bowdeniella nasicola TaxID=208480 RepID=UPI001C9E84E0